MLLLHPVQTSTDAAPDLCTLHPDLWTLCLWCFPSFNWCKHSTCSGGGCHQLQLALKVLFHLATSADSPLAHMVVSPSATCAGGAFSSSHWRKYCACTRAIACGIIYAASKSLVAVLEGKGFHTACASQLRFCATGCVIFWRNLRHWSSSSSHCRLQWLMRQRPLDHRLGKVSGATQEVVSALYHAP